MTSREKRAYNCRKCNRLLKVCNAHPCPAKQLAKEKRQIKPKEVSPSYSLEDPGSQFFSIFFVDAFLHSTNWKAFEQRERERERELWDLRVWGVCVSWPLLPFVNNLYFVAIIAIASGVSNLAVVCGAFLLFLYWSITKTSKSENSLILAQDVSSRDSSFLDREVIPAI